MEKGTDLTTLRTTRALFYVDAALWLVLGLAGVFVALRTGSPMRWIYSALMLINAGALVWLGTAIASGRGAPFRLAILYMTLNAVLSVTDQFGWIDAVVLLLSLSVLGMLFLSRHRLNQIAGAVPEGE